jgi:hypothetical protein
MVPDMPRELTYEQRNGEPFNQSRFGTKWTYEQWVAAQAVTNAPNFGVRGRDRFDADDFSDMVAQRDLLLKALEGMLFVFDDFADMQVLDAQAAVRKVRPR